MDQMQFAKQKKQIKKKKIRNRKSYRCFQSKHRMQITFKMIAVIMNNEFAYDDGCVVRRQTVCFWINYSTS